MNRIVARIARTTVIGAVGTAVISGAALLSAGLAAAATNSLSLNSGKSSYAAIEDSNDGVTATTYTVPAAGARPVYLGLQFRSPKDSIGYRTRVAIAPDGSVRLGITRVKDGKETTLLSEPINVWVSTGDKLHIEGSVTGTNPVTLKARAWTGSTAPAWQKTYTDASSARLTAGTTVRAWGFLSGTAAIASTPIKYSSDLSVAVAPTAQTAPAVATVPAAPAATPTPTAPASTTVPATPATPVANKKPTATTTGPTSSKLTRHDGNITVTKAGTVIENMDIHGFVTVKAANVIIRNSIVRGGTAKGNIGLITNYGYDNLLVEDTLVKRQKASVWVDGVKGWDFTLNRVHVIGGVDNVKIHGDNVTIKDSLLEGTDYFASDPNQGGGATHNDNVQILKGVNLKLTGNVIRDTTNFPIMNGAEHGNVVAAITGNWLDGGHCTVKVTSKKAWKQTTTLAGNHFGPNRKIAKCVVQAYTSTTVHASNNAFEQTGKAISIYWNNA